MSATIDEPARPSRRRFLHQALAGGFLATAPSIVGSLRAAGGQAPPSSKGGPTEPSAITGAAGPRPTSRARELAEMLRATPREKVFDAAAARVHQGATIREMLGGVLLAGVRDVRPWPPGVKFHTVLMVPSVLALAEASPEEEAWLGVFFNINVLKEAQERDIREGDWTLPPEPQAGAADPDRALAALAAAMEAWDVEAADRAATLAARRAPMSDLFEVLWPFAARDWANIGHLAIHAAQTHRALGMMDTEDQVAILRSLVYGLLGGRAGRSTASFDRNRARLGDVPPSWEKGRADPEVSLEVLRTMRAAAPDEASDLALSFLKRGHSPAPIWDGLRLCGAEILYRLRASTAADAQLLGVHPTTILNAFAYASRTSRREETRRLLLLQAAAWVASARDTLRDLKGLSMEGPGIDRIDPIADGTGAEKVVAQAAESRERAAAMALAAARDSDQAAALMARWRSLTLRKAPEHHHHKYAAALFEEFGIADLRWRPYLLAAAPTYLSHPGAKDSDAIVRARAALAAAA